MKSVAMVSKQVQQKPKHLISEAFCRNSLLKRFSEIKVGHLILHEKHKSWSFGDASNTDLVAEISVKNDEAYRRIALGGIVGSGEAYMLGYWSAADLVAVIRLMVANKQALNSLDSSLSWLKKTTWSVLDFFNMNSLIGSKRNIVAHYDLSNEFFSLFLDSSMMYSSAIYTDEHQNLELAAEYKLKHICERLNLKESDSVIEIGSGWGGFAIYAAKHYGCHVTTTTISNEQFAYAKARIEREGLGSKITLLNEDYRKLSGRYDKLVSIEMIEAVGHRYYKTFFNKCNSLLKEDGLALIQAITTGDHRFENEKNQTDFIRRYIFPGGCLPSNNVIAAMLTQYTNMQCVNYDDITLHYSKTLQHWREAFLEKLPQVRDMGFDSVFIRMWEFYLAYCEGGFAERVIHTGQFLFAKPLARDLPKIQH